jgi:hypothetical protein
MLASHTDDLFQVIPRPNSQPVWAIIHWGDNQSDSLALQEVAAE